MTLTVDESRHIFLQDGEPFFYQADTIWSAFTNLTMEEWDYYLQYRRRQSFNALQISMLPILHDASTSVLDLGPFAVREDGSWDFSSMSTAYFERAVAMVRAARNAGFIPALVVLWCNYVPGTWAAQRSTSQVMPYSDLPAYLDQVVRRFAPFDPIFVVSGDTAFEADEELRYYGLALKTLKERCPSSLTTLHLAPQAQLPDAVVQSPYLDFYMFQSGHHVEEAHRAYTLPAYFAGRSVRRPVVNGEPCYEGHGHGHRYARFSAFDVRRASWQSLLSGAGTGVTYGAHGVWSWHRAGQSFSSEAFSMRPFAWHDALQFDGAWDVAFAHTLVEQFDLFGLEARPDLLAASPEICLAGSSDLATVALYVPYPTEVALKLDPSGYRWSVIDLAARRWYQPAIGEADGSAIVPMHVANADVLVIGQRR